MLLLGSQQDKALTYSCGGSRCVTESIMGKCGVSVFMDDVIACYKNIRVGISSHSGTEDTRLNNACNSDPVCPPKCRCESNVVDCSNLKLTKIPEHIPASTTEL